MNLKEISKIEMQNRTIERSNKALKKWKSTNRKCVFPGCSCVAINSHIMSKEANLRCIAENGKVINMKPSLAFSFNDFFCSIIHLSDYPTVQVIVHPWFDGAG